MREREKEDDVKRERKREKTMLRERKKVMVRKL